MSYIDTKYINIVGQQLRNFKKKKENLFNCSCPICGDSAKKKTKARGYFYYYKNEMFYKCHNCHASMSLQYFLKSHYPSIHDSYALEKFSEIGTKSKSTFSNLKPKNLIKEPKANTETILRKFSARLRDLDDDHYAKRYISNRSIPKDRYDLIYYTEDFARLVRELFPDTQSKLYENDCRIVLPFYNSKSELIGLQGRSLLSDKSLRYITIKKDGEESLMYGLDRFNLSHSGYVVEGPIDSLFLPNCIATANSNLEFACEKVNSDLTLVFDNEPKNREILKIMERSIQNGRKVCIWNKQNKHKDINEMICSGMTKEDVISLINTRTFSGLNAMLEFNEWKRI